MYFGLSTMGSLTLDSEPLIMWSVIHAPGKSIVYYSMYPGQSTVYSYSNSEQCTPCTLNSVQCTPCTLNFVQRTSCTLNNEQCTSCTLNNELCTPCVLNAYSITISSRRIYPGILDKEINQAQLPDSKGHTVQILTRLKGTVKKKWKGV